MKRLVFEEGHIHRCNHFAIDRGISDIIFLSARISNKHIFSSSGSKFVCGGAKAVGIACEVEDARQYGKGQCGWEKKTKGSREVENRRGHEIDEIAGGRNREMPIQLGNLHLKHK